MSTVGERCVKALASSLWYIDPCHKQFHERSIRIPEVFEKFQGYNNWKLKKLKKPQLTYEGLTLHLEKLSSLLQQPWIFTPSFKELCLLLNSFANDFSPDDRFQRKNWFANFKLAIPCMLYRFMHGNNLGTLSFVWLVVQRQLLMLG